MTYALSLTGGGSYGAREVGVVDALIQVHGVKDYRIIAGTSTGALVALMLGLSVTNDDWTYWAEVRRIYAGGINIDDVFTRSLLDRLGVVPGAVGAVLFGEEAVYDSKPLEGLIKRFTPASAVRKMLSAAKRKKNPVEVIFAATNFDTGEPAMFTTCEMTTVKQVRDAVLASASAPVVSPGVTIDGDHYVDGGLVDNNPIELVVTSPIISDVETVISVDPGQAVGYVEFGQNRPTTVQAVQRTLSLLMDGVVQKDIETAKLLTIIAHLRDAYEMSGYDSEAVLNRLGLDASTRELLQHARQASVSVEAVPPFLHGSGSSFEFDPKVMKAMYREGFQHVARDPKWAAT